MPQPSQKTKKSIYELYSLTYDTNFSFTKKKGIFRASLGYETWAWRVVGISEKSIIALAKNNFDYVTLHRSHIVAASDICHKIFDEKKFAFNEWWDFVWQNDVTQLMTPQEHLHYDNNVEVHSKIYKIDENLGLFPSRAVGFCYGNTEKFFIQELVKKHNINID